LSASAGSLHAVPPRPLVIVGLGVALFIARVSRLGSTRCRIRTIPRCKEWKRSITCCAASPKPRCWDAWL